MGEARRIIIYTGTSITHEDARKILSNADYRPPVRRGNIIRAIREEPDVIGIIDGVFFNRAAVGHREILEAIKRGITVFGGASMGALRASELDRHGMIGVGTIYQRYRSEIYTSDDEVAVVLDPETCKPLSTPLVNIRETLHKAAAEDLITPAEEREIVRIARETYYPERNYRALLERARDNAILTRERAEELHRYIEEHAVDLKRDDAIEVIHRIKRETERR